MDANIDKEGCAGKSGYFGKEIVDVDVVVSLHSQAVCTDKEVLRRDQSVPHASSGETSKVNERSGLGFENEKFDFGEEEIEKKQEAFFSTSMGTTKTDDDDDNGGNDDETEQQQHWTTVRETEFLDSHEYQPPKILIDPSRCTVGKKIAQGG